MSRNGVRILSSIFDIDTDCDPDFDFMLFLYLLAVEKKRVVFRRLGTFAVTSRRAPPVSRTAYRKDAGCRPLHYFDPRFVDQNNGVAMNRVNEFPPEFAGTSDGGETWELIDYEGKAYNFALDSVPGTTNMFVTTGVTTGVEEENGASYSYDGGYTWQEFEEVDGVQLSNTGWVAGRIGWAGNFNGPDDPAVGGIYKYSPSEIADIDCSGNLAWAEVGAGSTQNGEFNVINEGSPLTFLNWEVESYPTWGTWQFNPDSGTDLVGGDETTVQVTVKAPSDTNSEFTGEVKLVNSDDPGDSCIIYVYLSTPRDKPPINSFFLRLLELFPNSFPVLRLLLGL